MTTNRLEDDLRDAFSTQLSLLPGDADARLIAVDYRPRTTSRLPLGLALTGAAAACATVSCLVLVPHGGSGPRALPSTGTAHLGQLQDVAFVTSRITKALDGVEHDVVSVTSNNVSAGGRELEHIWARADGSAQRSQTSVEGRLTGDFSTSDTGPTISVLYDTRTYWTQPAEPCTSGPKCGSSALPDPFTAAGIRSLIAGGDLTIVGRGEVVKGTRTIHLRGRSDAISLAGSLDMWVNAATYLPIRYTVTHASTERDAYVAYLPPTKQNLAQLTAPIPNGFTKTP